MPRAKSTTEQGRKHEEAMVKLMGFDNARRSRSSGASWNDPIDVVGDSFAMECESTTKQSYMLKLSFWDEVVMKSDARRMPTLGIQFVIGPAKHQTCDLVVMSADDFAMLMEERNEQDQK